MELLWGRVSLISGSDRGNNENIEIGNSMAIICSFRSAVELFFIIQKGKCIFNIDLCLVFEKVATLDFHRLGKVP